MTNKRLSWFASIIILVILLIIAAAVSLSIGSASISIKDIIKIILNPEAGVIKSIIFDIRLPRILLALAIGGSLALSGVLLQGMFRNPLVEPYTLGISGGAALGVSIGVITGLKGVLGGFANSFFGFIGATAIIFLIYAMSMRKNNFKVQWILLIGVMISFISSSLIMLIMALVRTEEIHSIIFWLMGSIEVADWAYIYIALAVSMIGLLISYLISMDLNALAMSEEDATHLGVDVERTKKIIFFTASLLTGVSVSFAGIVGFVGLVIPHFVRLLIGRDHRILLICSFLSGAIFLILCDTAARTIISPSELPVGVITGILGGAIFIYALVTKEKKGRLL